VGGKLARQTIARQAKFSRASKLKESTHKSCTSVFLAEDGCIRGVYALLCETLKQVMKESSLEGLQVSRHINETTAAILT
jgi:hypothetical protein